MEYVYRHLEQGFLEMSHFFKAVMVTGARQVGKTTMLKKLAEDTRRTFVTMDNLVMRDLAKSDPIVFFQTYQPPLIIDEIQYAPELFEQIKVMCDESDEKGRFWITGSQDYRVMKNVRETMAGRIGILKLYSLSVSEKLGVRHSVPLEFDFEVLKIRYGEMPKINILDVFHDIWTGGMPEIQNASPHVREVYFNSYVDTYLMRDVAELGGITDSLRFGKFLTACASLVGQEVNYHTLAETAGISEPTVKSWLELLVGLNIVYLLHPYSNNALKRLVKTPKLYFLDTGLASFLSYWKSQETLQHGAMAGSYFENHVVVQLLRSFANELNSVGLSYYRDSNKKEIDVFIEADNQIHPIEIKMGGLPDRREVRKFDILDSNSIPRGKGGIVCLSENVTPIDTDNFYIPCNLI
ncbi:MAG: ATP-binding protein [Lachnospiraceae bacterium]|jgi:predicted AAA+ superfamily ATPase|nr:ATP-binding protein [Lachnospiraceae bacterium]